MKLLFSLLIFVFTATSLAGVDCPNNYPNGNSLKYSNGAMFYPNGNSLRYSNGEMFYPNGNSLRYSNGVMNYENGNSLMHSNGSMYYENGNSLRYSNGTLFELNGSANQTGSVSFLTKFGDRKMKIVARSGSTLFQVSLPYGEAIMFVDFDDQGNVTCTVEGGNTSNEFRVEGSKGSAYVTLKPGQNAPAIKQAIQKILDGL